MGNINKTPAEVQSRKITQKMRKDFEESGRKVQLLLLGTGTFVLNLAVSNLICNL